MLINTEYEEDVQSLGLRQYDIPQIGEALGIVEEFVFEQRGVVAGTGGLCMLAAVAQGYSQRLVIRKSLAQFPWSAC